MSRSRATFVSLGILLSVFTGGAAQTITTGQSGIATQHTVISLAALPPITDAWSIAPATPTNFFAVGDNGTQDPPFPGGAVGTNYIVTTLDHVIRVQTRTGTTLYTVAITNFWEGLGPYSTARQVFDPKVVYDPYNDRWMMTAVSDFAVPRSSILVGVTQNGDPTGNWNLYRVEVDPAHALCANYPSIAFNKKWIVVCVEMRTNASPFASTSAQVYAFDKTNLYANGSGSFMKFKTGQWASDGPLVQEPAVTCDNTLDTLYLLNSWNGSQGTLGLFHIQGAIGSEVFVSHPLLQTAFTWDQGASGNGAFAPQLGTSEKILLDDARMQGLIYRNGSLWAAHTVFVPAGGSPTRGAIQWYQITTNGVFLQKGRIEDQTGKLFYGYPSIAVNQLNDALVGYARFSTSEYASAYYSIRSHSDSTNTFQADRLLKAGNASFERSVPPLRWGDHSSTVVDPVNDLDFWTIQEFATSTDVAPTSRWGTWWGRVIGEFVDLSISKTALPAQAVVGSNLTYSITVTNLTAVPAASVTVTDALPVGVTFVSAAASQGSCTNVNGTVTCSLSTIASNAGASVQIVVVPTQAGTLTNTASSATAATDSNLTNNVTTNIITVIAAAHLTVTPASRDFGVLTAGQTSTQSFSVINTGTATLNGTATASGVAFGLVSGGTFNLLANETGNVSVSFSPATAGSFTGSVIFASNGGNSTNPVTGAALTPPQLGVSPASFNFGTLITGTTSQTTFVVTNSGQSVLTGTASVSGSTFAVVSGATYSVGASGSSNIVVSFNPAFAGSFTNQVIFTSNGGVSSNSVTGSGVTPALLGVNPASFNFGTIATGTTAQTSFVVTNKGGAVLSGSGTIAAGAFAIAGGSPFNFNVAGFAATNMAVNFTPPGADAFATNLVVASNGGVSTNALNGTGAIVPLADFSADVTNGLVPLAVTFTNKSSGTITNAFWDFGDGASTNTLTVSVAHTYNVPGTNTVILIASGPVGVSTNVRVGYIVARVPTADLQLTKTATSNSVPQGQNLTYTLSVTNRGPDAATSVTITDALPASVVFVSVATSQGTCTNIGGTVVCDLAALPVGTNAVVSLVATPSVTGTITNRAVVFTATTDPNLSNNTGTVAVAVLPAADLAMTQTAAPNPVLTSQNVTYTLTVTNLGPSAGSSVTVTDALPAGFSFVSANASQGTCSNVGGIVTCSLGTISTGSTASAQITATPSASSNVTNISNAATVTAAEFDPAATNNTATVSIVVYRDADSDGIPDYWTEQFFGHGTGQVSDNSRAGDDADGDGLSNMQEYLAGTSPVDANSALRIVAIEGNETNVLICFASVTNKQYRLEWSDGPVGPWTNIVADAIAGTGDKIQVPDASAAAMPQRYYRVRLLP